MNTKFIEVLEEFISIFPRTDGNRNYDYGYMKLIHLSKEEHLLNDISEIDLFFKLVEIGDRAMIGQSFLQDIYGKSKSKEVFIEWKSTESEFGLNKDWIPIGDRNGDLIFCKSEIIESPVYGNILGSWDPILIADSLSSYLLCLKELMLIEQNDFNFVTEDEDCVPLDSFILKVRNVCEKYLTEKAVNGFIYMFFG